MTMQRVSKTRRKITTMTDDLDNLRPEVREAVEHCDRNFALAPYNGHRANWPAIRAVLRRLSRENDEWQTRCLQFQTERDKARAELDALRNIQSTLADEVTQKERAESELAAIKDENAQLRDVLADRDMDREMAAHANKELAALKAKVAESPRAYHSSFEFTLDASTLYARATGVPGEETYALVKVEE
jgi:uncharacterized protein (DUF3084 family)